MGNLLGSPVTDKETHVGETDCGVKYGVSTMQGWRVHMEDAHICQPHLYAQEGGGPDAVKVELPGHALFAVFDGHGGSFAAEYAGTNFCRVLSRQPDFVQYAKFVQERPTNEPTNDTERAQYLRAGLELLENALKAAFIDCDREILLALQGKLEPEAHAPYHAPQPHSEINPVLDQVAVPPPQPQPQPNDDEDPGTTIVVAVVTPEWVVCANAGDSRAVFSKSGGKAVPLSYDHKPDDEAEEKRIREAGGYVAGGRVEGDLAVSRGLGDYRFKEPKTVLMGAAAATHFANANNHSENMILPENQKVSPLPDVVTQNRHKNNDEFIIIACDGIWDVQTNYEGIKSVADIFADGETDLGLACEEVLDMCLAYGSKDNMTAMILQFEAQKIATGGGVLARRKQRVAQDKNSKGKSNESKTAEELYT
jgi:serine/threonine protein phosphatase PrpC